jgi:hypothetical protein
MARAALLQSAFEHDRRGRPQQGARHTFCSAWLRQHGDINKLVIQAGHESPAVLWNHYYQTMSPKDAMAFWNIFPPAREARQIIPFENAVKG